MALFRALNQRTFAWLWTGQTVSRLGDYLYQIALGVSLISLLHPRVREVD